MLRIPAPQLQKRSRVDIGPAEKREIRRRLQRLRALARVARQSRDELRHIGHARLLDIRARRDVVIEGRRPIRAKDRLRRDAEIARLLDSHRLHLERSRQAKSLTGLARLRHPARQRVRQRRTRAAAHRIGFRAVIPHRFEARVGQQPLERLVHGKLSAQRRQPHPSHRALGKEELQIRDARKFAQHLGRLPTHEVEVPLRLTRSCLRRQAQAQPPAQSPKITACWETMPHGRGPRTTSCFASGTITISKPSFSKLRKPARLSTFTLPPTGIPAVAGSRNTRGRRW